MANAREREMAKLYMEAVQLIIKLANKIRQEECPNAQPSFTRSKGFLERNELYEDGVKGLLK